MANKLKQMGDEQNENAVRFRQVIQKALFECDHKIAIWAGHCAQYETLRNRLETLPAVLSHDVMVPFGKVAFMPGKIVRTNEIMVLLGDNWFVERSAFQAIEIINRRLTYVERSMNALKEERMLIESRLSFSPSTDIPQQNDQNVIEIKEEYNEETETKFKERRSEISSKPKGVDSDQFDALMRHLDELDKLEEQESDFESIDSDDLNEPQVFTATHSEPKTVHWQHNDKNRNDQNITKENESEEQIIKPKPKSILRNKDEKTPVNRNALLVSDPPSKTVIPISSTVFTGVITETNKSKDGSQTSTSCDRPVSKFRQKRQNIS